MFCPAVKDAKSTSPSQRCELTGIQSYENNSPLLPMPVAIAMSWCLCLGVCSKKKMA